VKIHTTIFHQYRPKWGFFQGAREMIQNAFDGAKEARLNGEKSSFKVDFTGASAMDDSGTIRIENEGMTFDKSCLLLGKTTKQGRSDMIGQFGDGMKIGMLALVRAGFEVKIRNGDELWIPTLESSDKFDGEQVLVINVTSGRKWENRVRVEISGVTREQFLEIKEAFLFLSSYEKHSTPYGELLLDKKFRGQVFVKGILVESETDFQYGYNLTNVETDVDRKLINSYDRDYNIRSIWREALKAEPMQMLAKFMQLLADQAKDVANISSYDVDGFDKETIDAVANNFIAMNGEDAIPVTSMDESKDAAHLGKKGVIVPKPMAALLGKRFGAFDKVKEKLAKEAIKFYSWHDLDSNEQSNLDRAMNLIERDIKLVDIADFRDTGIHGLCNLETKRIEIAKKELATLTSLIGTLIHEFAHSDTGADDGAKLHVATIENSWEKLTTKLLKQIDG